MPTNPYPLIPWMNTAYSLIGTKETPGSRNTEEILQWARVIGVDDMYKADSIPWCGLFVGFCMADNGLMPVNGPLLARDWNAYGSDLTPPSFGGIMVWPHHVGFYVDETQDRYMILGGNQSDAVTITSKWKYDCLGGHWPPGMEKFLTTNIPMS